MEDNSMATDKPEDIIGQLAQVVEEHLAKREQEAARDLICDAFSLLPLELQDLYLGVVELYREGKREQASKLFEEWMDQAKELGLI